MAGYTTLLCILMIILDLSKGAADRLLSLTPATVNVTEGESAILTLNITNECRYLRWYFDNEVKLELLWNGTTYSKSANYIGVDLAYTCNSNQNNSCVCTLGTGQITREQHNKHWYCRYSQYLFYSSSVFVYVKVPITGSDVISPTTSPVRTSENYSSTFVCETSPGRPQATIHWYKQLGTTPAVPIAGGVDTTIQNESLIITRSTLRIIATRIDHNYRVFCTAFNINGSFTLNAPDSGPVLEGHPGGSIFYTVDGKSQSLTCSVEGGRPLASLSWNCFAGTALDESTGTATKQHVTWIAAMAHDGRWCNCQASHLLWTTTQHANVTIQVLYPPTSPTFTMQGQTVSATVYVIEGSNMSVTCNSTSNPPPAYAWLPKGSSSNNTILKLTNVTISDTGVYICTVSNTMIPSQGNREGGLNSATLSIEVVSKHPEGPDDQCSSLNAAVAAGTGAAGLVCGIGMAAVTLCLLQYLNWLTIKRPNVYAENTKLSTKNSDKTPDESRGKTSTVNEEEEMHQYEDLTDRNLQASAYESLHADSARSPVSMIGGQQEESYINLSV